jgi:hypothetical protein
MHLSKQQVGVYVPRTEVRDVGQKQTFERVRAMSALPPKADIRWRNHVQFVPQADSLARLADGLTFEFEFLTCHILPPIRA